MGGDKEKDGLDGVKRFKTGHSCNVLSITPSFIIVGGSKIHMYDKETDQHVREIKTGHDVTAMHFNPLKQRLHAGLSDGNIKVVHFEEGADKPPETAETLKKVHSSAVIALEDGGAQLYSGASDGSVTVWDSGTPCFSREKPKKGAKHNIMKFFPDKEIVVVASPEKTVVFKHDTRTFNEDECITFVGMNAAAKAVTGYTTDIGARVFIGLEDGSIVLYDLRDEGCDGALRPTLTLERLHTKAIHCLGMYGQYLVGTAQDKLVSMWNGKEHSTECNLLRKLQHKGTVTALAADGGPADDDGTLWCFDESNKKIYRIIMKEHLPNLTKGHKSRLTFEVDPMPSVSNSSINPNATPDEIAVAIEAALSPAPISSDGGEEGTSRLEFKDFYSDVGTVQQLLDLASEWIAGKGSSIQLISVTTVPIIGSKLTSDALFKHSLSQAVYEAALRTKPEHAVPVIQVVRVIYMNRGGGPGSTPGPSHGMA